MEGQIPVSFPVFILLHYTPNKGVCQQQMLQSVENKGKNNYRCKQWFTDFASFAPHHFLSNGSNTPSKILYFEFLLG
jgi:hypothetical protein